METLISMRTIIFLNSGDPLPKTLDSLWLIISGVVKTYTINEEGILITLGFWGVQDIVGKPLSNLEPYSIDCITDVRAVSVPKSEWGKLSTAILRHGQETQRLTYIVRSPRIYNRLWMLLKWLASRFGCVIKQGRLIDFKLTHQELADAIGATRITVTKILSQLEQDGLISRPNTKCIIVNC